MVEEDERGSRPRDSSLLEKGMLGALPILIAYGLSLLKVSPAIVFAVAVLDLVLWVLLFSRSARRGLQAAGAFVWSLRPTTHRNLEKRRRQWHQTDIDLQQEHEREVAMLKRSVERCTQSGLELQADLEAAVSGREADRALHERYVARLNASHADARGAAQEQQVQATRVLTEQYQDQIAAGWAKAKEWEERAVRGERVREEEREEQAARLEKAREEGRAEQRVSSERRRNQADAERARVPRPDPSQGPRPATHGQRTVAVRVQQMQKQADSAYVPDPHWRIFEDPEIADLWAFGSAIAESRSERVRLQADRRTFDLADGGYWPEIGGGFTGQHKSFRGRATRFGLDHGIVFTVRWIDPITGGERSEEVRGVVGAAPL